MIIEFFVKNFTSFKEVQTLSFVASNYDKSHPENYIDPQLPGMKGMKLLKGVVIYGANAAGKSNMLRALHWFKRFVKESFHAGVKSRKMYFYMPFLLGEESLACPTEFEIRFVCEGIRYHYHVAVNDVRILTEELSSYPKGRKQLYYSRVWKEQEYEWDIKIPALVPIKPMINDNVLALSAGFALNCEPLKPIYAWFAERMLYINVDEPAVPVRACKLMLRMNNEARQEVWNLFKKADLGIVAGEFREVEPRTMTNENESYPEGEQRSSANNRTVVPEIEKRGFEIGLFHKGEEEKMAYQMLWENESKGTQKMFSLAPHVLDMLHSGKIWLSDEIETSLHPLMVEALLKKIFSEENTKGAQLICTTHSAELLNADILRRDQIYLVEKDDKGRSSLIPLSDYSPRKGESLGSGYLAGRYGAIPFIEL